MIYLITSSLFILKNILNQFCATSLGNRRDFQGIVRYDGLGITHWLLHLFDLREQNEDNY